VPTIGPSPRERRGGERTGNRACVTSLEGIDTRPEDDGSAAVRKGGACGVQPIVAIMLEARIRLTMDGDGESKICECYDRFP